MAGSKSLRYIINHVFLPPKLPSIRESDEETMDGNKVLAEQLLAALRLFQPHSAKDHDVWPHIIKLVEYYLAVHVDGSKLPISGEKLQAALKQMQPRDVMPIHVRVQNAGLIVRRQPESFTIEAFELTPPDQYINSTTGSLRRSLPGPAVKLSAEDVLQTIFQCFISKFLPESGEVFDKYDGLEHDQPPAIRPPDPELITDCFMPMLQAIGEPAKVCCVSKRTREDAVYGPDYGEKHPYHNWAPWRRSSLWLLFRVTLQTSLVGQTDTGQETYKAFTTFFKAQILKLAVASRLPSDTLFVLSSAIGRRVVKLDLSQRPPWYQPIATAVSDAQALMERRWHEIRSAKLSPTPADLATVVFSKDSDTVLRFPDLEEYLVQLEQQTSNASAGRNLDLPKCYRIQQDPSKLPQLTPPGAPHDPTTSLSLVEFEKWVEDNLEEFLTVQQTSKSTCMELANLIETYVTIACEAYSAQPHSLSVAILTAVELWIALDRCTVARFPLLVEYGLPILESLFEPLILPSKSQLGRLHRVERYLARRASSADKTLPAIFESANEPRSFGVRYFDNSRLHQDLLKSIQDDAHEQRLKKKQELDEKSKAYHQLVQLMLEVPHKECLALKGRKKQIKNCSRCKLESDAEEIMVEVHQWPLPNDMSARKTLIFELHVPEVLARWRDVALAVWIDMCSPHQDSNPKSYELLRHNRSLNIFSTPNPRRLQLASKRQNWPPLPISTAEEDPTKLFVDHLHTWNLFDSKTSLFTSKALNQYNIRTKCTPLLQDSSYFSLQYALEDTKHTSNEVIARTHECPDELSRFEYQAFGALRSGHRLQLMNIARELAGQTMDLKAKPVRVLIQHAVLQAGPSADTEYRDSHADMRDTTFGMTLLEVLRSSLQTMGANWQNIEAAITLATLGSRLLSLALDEAVQTDSLAFLHKLRHMTFQWLRSLIEEARGQAGEEGVKHWNSKIFLCAYLCLLTFDVDRSHVSSVLDSDEDMEAAVTCYISCHDHIHCFTDEQATIGEMRHKILSTSLLLEPRLRESMLAGSRGANRAISSLWSGQNTVQAWALFSEGDESRRHWLVSATGDGHQGSRKTLQFNILNGSLLIDGLPFSKIPDTYRKHSTYNLLFGQNALDVESSTLPAMLFATRRRFFGKQVHFRLEKNILRIQTTDKNGKYEYIPREKFEGCLPQYLVDNSFHWLDLVSKRIEWRPSSDPWSTSAALWIQEKRGESHFLSHGLCRRVNSSSAWARAVSGMLAPLDRSQSILMAYNEELLKVEIFLPRLQLTFLWDPETQQFEAKQFPGSVIDGDQCLGTLTGLQARLVLLDLKTRQRTVLIPRGHASFLSHGDHGQVCVETEPMMPVLHNAYSVDSKLGRLVGAGTLHSSLYLAHLHALTSYCLPDELTGRTGTEQALHILQSRGLQSFKKLEPQDVKLLESIQELAPSARFRPGSHIQVVQWSKTLPQMSQHPLFMALTSSILRQDRQFHAVFPEPSTPQRVNNFDRGLFLRRSVRDAAIRRTGYGAERFKTVHDEDYPPKNDQTQAARTERAVKTLQVASLVQNWSTRLKTSCNLLRDLEGVDAPLSGHHQNSDGVGRYMDWLTPPQSLLKSRWCNLQRFLANADRSKHRHHIMAALCIATYSGEWSEQWTGTLLALATVPRIRQHISPAAEAFELGLGYEVSRPVLVNRLNQSCLKPQGEWPEEEVSAEPNEKISKHNNRRRKAQKNAKDRCVTAFATKLMNDRLNSTVSVNTYTDYESFMCIEDALGVSEQCYTAWNQNREFRAFIGKLQDDLKTLKRPRHSAVWQAPRLASTGSARHPRTFVRLQELFSRQDPPSLPAAPALECDQFLVSHDEDLDGIHRVETLIDRLGQEKDNFSDRYTKDLKQSLEARTSMQARQLLPDLASLTTALRVHESDCEKHYNCVSSAVKAQLQPSSAAFDIARSAKIWPCLSPSSLLPILNKKGKDAVSDGWKACLTQYGLALAEWQRAQRLVQLIKDDKSLLKELVDNGRKFWDPLVNPEWLLIEIEDNLTIRAAQARVSKQMISPSSGKNSVLQLNMGEGKSSVIIPMVAAALADGTRLVRVVALRPLMTQMFEHLAQKLGGLLDRKVFFMPFTRSSPLDSKGIEAINNLMKDCMRSGGALLTQPEHVLSFELLGPEKLISTGESAEIGREVLATRNWLESNSRDILDESDEILGVKFELVYGMGAPDPVDHYPARWVITQYVLELVERSVKRLKDSKTRGIEVDYRGRPAAFPLIRVAHPDLWRHILDSVAYALCAGDSEYFSISSHSTNAQGVIFKFIRGRKLERRDENLLEKLTKEPLYRSLLVAKGLLSEGVLLFTIRDKRWRVHYGLSLSRTTLSVPYKAKDTPDLRSEWSHPDVAISLTCLSYYYGGLTDQQLLSAFYTLLTEDSGRQEYAAWIQKCSLPNKYHDLNGINLTHISDCAENLFPWLKFNKRTIDFYLSHIVFPPAMKQYPNKLSLSAWDIARRKSHVTTGFSGTNDSRHLLPLATAQLDFPEELHTNASVIMALLEPQNQYIGLERLRNAFEDEDFGFLIRTIAKASPRIQVLLDVGAQILEPNKTVAELWLKQIPNTETDGAVFFDDDNELIVIDRSGNAESLATSPFARNLERCVVYLDESHTRGIDLKLPSRARAAVLLGPNLTKDRLVQACMRMRKLGRSGQSLVFYGSAEVEQHIYSSVQKDEELEIDVSDVLLWSVRQTFDMIKKGIGVWATQGSRHLKHRAVWEHMSRGNVSDQVAKRLLEEDAQTLAQRYSQKRPMIMAKISHERDGQVDPPAEFNEILETCRAFELDKVVEDASMEDEQEREVAPENEVERHVERSKPLRPYSHRLSDDVKNFVQSGSLNLTSTDFEPAFNSLSRTSAAANLEALEFGDSLLITRDFLNTVEVDKEVYDEYLRPVHWLLSSQDAGSSQYLIISPFEANEVLPAVRTLNKVRLHAYAPRTTLGARSLDDLAFCAVPPLPAGRSQAAASRELNLFAGQTYLNNVQEYVEVCRLLGVRYQDPGNAVKVMNDGFIVADDRPRFDVAMAQVCRFSESPLCLLRMLLGMRSKGKDSFKHSHMGKIVFGTLLEESDFPSNSPD